MSSRRSMQFILFWLVLGYLMPLLAQDYAGFLETLYFFREPSARSEAMGRALVTTGDGAISSFYNPAAVGMQKGYQAAYATSSPLYLLDEASWRFAAVTAELGQWGVIGISQNEFRLPLTLTSANGREQTEHNSGPTMKTLSYANRVSGFAFGFNVSYVHDEIEGDDEDQQLYDVFIVDAGAIHSFKLPSSDKYHQDLHAGAVLKNALLAEANDVNKSVAPVILALGASYQLSPKKVGSAKSGPVDLLLVAEYQQILNANTPPEGVTPDRSSFRFGGELAVLKMFFPRVGWFTEDIDNGFEGNVTQLRDFTYGAGVKLPLGELLGLTSRLELGFDYTSLEQPSYTERISEWDRFNTFSFGLSWIPGK